MKCTVSCQKLFPKTVLQYWLYIYCTQKWIFGHSQCNWVKEFFQQKENIISFHIVHTIYAYPLFRIKSLSVRLRVSKLFEHKIAIISLSISLNICCGNSKEPSQWDGSFEYLQQNLNNSTMVLNSLVCMLTITAHLFVMIIKGSIYLYSPVQIFLNKNLYQVLFLYKKTAAQYIEFFLLFKVKHQNFYASWTCAHVYI